MRRSQPASRLVDISRLKVRTPLVSGCKLNRQGVANWRLGYRQVLRKLHCLGFPASPRLREETGMLESLADSLTLDFERPTYHVAPRSGWMNDPNGPVYHQGEYHLFFQHIVHACDWEFGIVWGHVVSKDLVHWEHLAHALTPSPGEFDADGCFSGCAVVDTDGTPTILYTGVRLRSNPECQHPHPPSGCDLNLPFIESQLIATAHQDDSTLETWVKQEKPMIPLPPSDMNLTGWRDPYIFETINSQKQREWGMLMGSGIKGVGGSIMIYRSKNLREGWRYDGMLCESANPAEGRMWECPILVELNQVPTQPGRHSQNALHELSKDFHNMTSFREHANGDSAKSASVVAANDPRDASAEVSRNGTSNGVEAGSTLGNSGRPFVEFSEEDEPSTSGQHHHTHFLCISPDEPANPTLYWLGDFDAQSTRFLLDKADGPYHLDLGNIVYAPNLMIDEKGRHILWAWLQERRKTGQYDYAGCMCVPRLIYKRGNKLIQEPVPEIAGLRKGKAWQESRVVLDDTDFFPLTEISGPAVEVQATFERGSCMSAGIMINSWSASSEGSAAIVYDWTTNRFEVVFEGEAYDEQNDNKKLRDRIIGGEVPLGDNEEVQMRLLLDGSALECFLGTGEVLSTRIYRGNAPPGVHCGLDLVSFGGSATVTNIKAWEVNSIWQGVSKLADMQEHLTAQNVKGGPIPV